MLTRVSDILAESLAGKRKAGKSTNCDYRPGGGDRIRTTHVLTDIQFIIDAFWISTVLIPACCSIVSFPDLRRMPKNTYTETKIIRDLAHIMAENQGPFTRKMLAEHLSKIYPDKYYQELMNEISCAI